MAFLWLTVFLTPVFCLLMTDQDPNSPIKNLRMEPRSQRLTWDLNGNVTEIHCFQNSDYPRKARNNRYCQFHALPSCTAVNYTVSVTKGQQFSASIQYPQQEGNPGAAPENLQCWVHDVDSLTCTWAVGSEAPGDVQYRLYMEDRGTYKQWECPRYAADERGTHVQCHFDDVSRLSEGFYRFLVNGTSRASRIPCSEIFKGLSEIERLSPPNITGWCNKSYAVMEWKMSSHFTLRFNYELQIQKGTDPAYTLNVLEKTSFVLHNPGTYTVQIRAHGFYTDTVSEWSAPESFVCDREEEGTRLRVWLTALLTALGTLLALGVLLLVCRRFSVMQKLFPPIPHVKDPISDNLDNKLMVWEPGRASREECPVAQVQVLGET